MKFTVWIENQSSDIQEQVCAPATRTGVCTCDKHGGIVDVCLVCPEQIGTRSEFKDGADG